MYIFFIMNKVVQIFELCEDIRKAGLFPLLTSTYTLMNPSTLYQFDSEYMKIHIFELQKK